MKPNFPMKNLAINDLIEWRSMDRAYEISHALTDGWGLSKEILKLKLENLDTLLDHMENEINQIIHTANDSTKIALFEELKQNISDHKLFDVDRKGIRQKAEEWNELKNEEFEQKQEEKTNEYFSNPDVQNHGHLEQYKVRNRTLLLISRNLGDYITRTNYKYFTIEDKAELIDFDTLDTYAATLDRFTAKFRHIVEPLINQYDQGKIILVKQAKETRSDRWLNRIKDNPAGAFLIVSGIVLISILGFVKLISETSTEMENAYERYYPSDTIPSNDTARLKIESNPLQNSRETTDSSSGRSPDSISSATKRPY